MTDEQITTISREYAEEMIKDSSSEGLPTCLKNSMLALNTEYIAEIFQWLTRRFYLVEKSKIQEEYQKAQTQIKDGKEFDVHVLVTIGASKESLLESLFPEITKEVDR